jgi:hypothetical protein
MGYAKGGKIGHRLNKFYNEAKDSDSVMDLKVVDKDLFTFTCKSDKNCKVRIEYNDDSDTVVMHQKYSKDNHLSNDDDISLEQFKKYLSEKMAKGGKLVGNQANLDMNKNGRLDKEDFEIIRGEKKMADGGEIWTVGEYQTIEDWKSVVKPDGTKKTESVEGYPIRKNGVNVYVLKSKKEAIAKANKLNSKKKMAKGGVTRKNSIHRFCWTKEAVKDGIIKKEQLKDTPTKYHRKKYPAYIMEK